MFPGGTGSLKASEDFFILQTCHLSRNVTYILLSSFLREENLNTQNPEIYALKKLLENSVLVYEGAGGTCLLSVAELKLSLFIHFLDAMLDCPRNQNEHTNPAESKKDSRNLLLSHTQLVHDIKVK
jgi:hypothetical protein